MPHRVFSREREHVFFQDYYGNIVHKLKICEVLEMKYGVKVIYTYTVGNNYKKYYEEQILSVNAGSFEEAYEKAEKYAAGYNDAYTNPRGDRVKTEKIEVLDCFLALEEEADVQEIYSSFMKNKTSLTENEFYDAITNQCNAKELYNLRYQEFNKSDDDI